MAGSPTKLLQRACYTKLSDGGVSAYVDPEPGDALPYVVLGGGLHSYGRLTNKDKASFVIVMEFRSWAHTLSVCQDLVDSAMQLLTDRGVDYAVSGWVVSKVEPDFIGEPILDERFHSSLLWETRFRVRYELMEA